MREISEFNGFNQGWAIGFQGEGCEVLNQDFFLVGERLLWVVCSLTVSAIERPLFHTNCYNSSSA
jgi:hypothetical protein